MTTTDFADLLRHLRLEAGLTQELLAQRAGLSVDAVRGYERRLKHAPRRETIRLLVEALQLRGSDQAAFEAAADRKRGSYVTGTGERRDNLPWQPTSFVGRHSEIEQLSALIAPRRIVTITGAGGKTRTALEVASRIPQRHAQEIWFLDLADGDDAAFVFNRLTTALDLQIPANVEPLAAVITAIKHREMVIIFDNCEHILATIRPIAKAILKACQQIALLATSRERLGIAGEQVFPLSSLPIATALELFAERAITVAPDFAFTGESIEVGTDICRRLDCVSLAIELAAARLHLLGIFELRAQLARHFQVIASGNRDIPARQQTLNAMLSWSHDLLDDPERMLFRRLSIFANGWTLEAAETVCADIALEREAVLDALFSLVEKSLVVVNLDTTTPRYSFFQATRQFALDKCLASADHSEVSRRHAEWIASLADRVYEMYGILPRRQWEEAILPDFDNALAALEWALGADGDNAIASRIASGLRGFWQTAGRAAYGKRFVSAALEGVGPHTPPQVVARLLLAQNQFVFGMTRVNLMRRAIALLGDDGDRRMLAKAFGYLSGGLAEIGQFTDAENASDAAATLINAERLEKTQFYSDFLFGRALMFRAQSRSTEAKAAAEDALSLALEFENDTLVPMCQSVLADMAFATGDMTGAVKLGEEAVASAHRVSQTSQEACSLANLACVHLLLGEADSAERHAIAALALGRTYYETNATHAAIQHLAAIAAQRGQAKRAARLIGYVNRWYEKNESERDPIDQASYDLLMASLHEQLSAADISTFAAQGALMIEEAAATEALSP